MYHIDKCVCVCYCTDIDPWQPSNWMAGSGTMSINNDEGSLIHGGYDKRERERDEG